MTDLISREAVLALLDEYVVWADETISRLRALPAAQVNVEKLVWEPIDTAPKDGTRVILWRGPAKFGKQSEMVIAEWHGGEWQWPDEAENPCTHGEWSEEDRQGGYYSDGRYFTHWMPLPTAPIDASQMPDPATKMRCAECWCDGGECEWIATGNETEADPVLNEETNTEQSQAFWGWLPLAYRDGHVGEQAKFTKYNMEVAHLAGWQHALTYQHDPVLTDPRVKALVEAAYAEGFSEGADGGWVEGDYSKPWAKSAALREIGGEA